MWARKKADSQANDPHHAIAIYCRITVAGAKNIAPVNFSTGFETVKSNWEAASGMGRVLGRTQADRLINSQLTKLRDELNDYHADLERQGKPVTARRIYALYCNNGSVLSLLELFEQFLAEQKTLVGVEVGKHTTLAHQVRYSNLRLFLEAHKLTDLRPE